MKKFLKKILVKIGLLDSFTIELTVSTETMVAKLSKMMDDYQPYLFDIFTFNKKEYKGYIRIDKFEIKKCKKFMVSFDHLAEAIGRIKTENNKLIIRTEVSSIQPYVALISFGLSALFFLLIGLAAILFTLTTGEIEGLYVGLAIISIGIIFLGIPVYNEMECLEFKV